MTLKLNEIEIYKKFYGRNIEQMPKLIAEGRIPMSVSQLMKRRLDVRNSEKEVKSSWLDNYFDTGDAIAYHPNGNMKIVLDSEILRQLNPESKLKNGVLVLEDGVYEKIDSGEFTRKELENCVEKYLTKEQARENLVWNVLARDKNLLNDYTNFIFAEAKKRFNYNDNLGVYLDSPSDYPKLRALYLNGLEFRSYVSGRGSLDGNIGLFAGLAPEARKKISE